jgi:hypothetical protein
VRVKASSHNRVALLTFVGLSLVILGLVNLLLLTGESAFGRFLGGLPPMTVFAGAAGTGGVLLATVLRRAGFAVARHDGAGGWVLALEAAAVFGAVVVAADSLIVFPRNMNVPFPRSLAFYPAMSFLVEVLFHLVPLSILLVPLAFTKAPQTRDRVMVVALALTAFLEPVYQALYQARSGGYRPWAIAFVTVHVLAINVVGLWLFYRYDFVTMWGFRLLYYLIWHVAWGALRLDVLF